MVSARCLTGRKRTADRAEENEVQAVKEDRSAPEVPADEEETGGLMFAVPGESDLAESEEEAVPDVVTEVPAAEEPERILREAAAAEAEAEEDEAAQEDFFPLEIDNGDEIEVKENPDLLGVAAMVAGSAAPPADEIETDIDDSILSFPEVPSAPDTDSEPDDESAGQKLDEKEAGSEDWLSSHMNLLNKLGK